MKIVLFFVKWHVSLLVEVGLFYLGILRYLISLDVGVNQLQNGDKVMNTLKMLHCNWDRESWLAMITSSTVNHVEHNYRLYGYHFYQIHALTPRRMILVFLLHFFKATDKWSKCWLIFFAVKNVKQQNSHEFFEWYVLTI